MAESKPDAELAILHRAFHVLARNLFTYAAEGGVFLSFNDKDRAIAKIRDEATELSLELSDRIADLLVEKGHNPRASTFAEEYTYWSYKTESGMLHHYLEELAAHRRSLIALANRVDAPESPLGAVLEEGIHSREKFFTALAAHAEGVCAVPELEARESILDGRVKISAAS